MKNFDKEMQKFFDDMKLNISIEQLIKISETNKTLFNRMKKKIKQSNNINNRKYNLKMNIVNFEVYFSKLNDFPLSFSIFDNKDGDIFIYDNMKSVFYKLKEALNEKED